MSSTGTKSHWKHLVAIFMGMIAICSTASLLTPASAQAMSNAEKISTAGICKVDTATQQIVDAKGGVVTVRGYNVMGACARTLNWMQFSAGRTDNGSQGGLPWSYAQNAKDQNGNLLKTYKLGKYATKPLYFKSNGSKTTNKSDAKLIAQGTIQYYNGRNELMYLDNNFLYGPSAIYYALYTNTDINPQNISATYSDAASPDVQAIRDKIKALDDAYFDHYITLQDIQYMAEQGVTCVRLPIEYSYFLAPSYTSYKNKGGYWGTFVHANVNGVKPKGTNWNENTLVNHSVLYKGKITYADISHMTSAENKYFTDRMTRLENLVNAFGAAGIRVILDLHLNPGNANVDGDNRRLASLYYDEKKKSTVITEWGAIAKHFKSNPYVLGYDLLNEPGPAEKSWENTVCPLLLREYNVIRKSDTEHIIFMPLPVNGNTGDSKDTAFTGNYHFLTADSSFSLKTQNILSMITTKNMYNVALTEHNYFDGDASGQHTEFAPPSNVMLERQERALNSMRALQKKCKLPIYIGETSYYDVEDKTSIQSDAPEEKGATAQTWKTALNRYNYSGFGYTLWQYKASYNRYYAQGQWGRKIYNSADEIKNIVGALGATHPERFVSEVKAGSTTKYCFKRAALQQRQIALDEKNQLVSYWNYNDLMAIMSLQSFQYSKNLKTTNGDWYAALKDSFTHPIGTWTIKQEGKTSVTATLSPTGLLTIDGKGQIPNYAKPQAAPWYAMRNSIKEIEIHNGITRVGNNAFRNCNDLKEIHLPKIISLSESAFPPSSLLPAANYCKPGQKISIKDGWYATDSQGRKLASDQIFDYTGTNIQPIGGISNGSITLDLSSFAITYLPNNGNRGAHYALITAKSNSGYTDAFMYSFRIK